MGAEKKLLSVKEAFQLPQQPHQNQEKFQVALSRSYCKKAVRTYRELMERGKAV